MHTKLKKPKNRLSLDAYQKLFPIQLQQRYKIAFVLSPRLGDSLLSMVVVNNLVRAGYNVAVFGDYMMALQTWFPWVCVQPRPKPHQAKDILSAYDVVLHAFTADLIGDIQQWHPFVRILEQSIYNWQEKPMVDIQVDFCRHEFLLNDVSRSNNIMIPSQLCYKKNRNRIMIHPTSHQSFRNWLPQRFVELANELKIRGYEPQFIVSSEERPSWLWLMDQGHSLPTFTSLEEVAMTLYESGGFIGNDSGIGHLASNLGIPTVTLGIRRKLLQRWRPAWAPGVVLLPPSWLCVRPLKQKFWKYFISVEQVLNGFDRSQKLSGVQE